MATCTFPDDAAAAAVRADADDIMHSASSSYMFSKAGRAVGAWLRVRAVCAPTPFHPAASRWPRRRAPSTPSHKLGLAYINTHRLPSSSASPAAGKVRATQ